MSRTNKPSSVFANALEEATKDLAKEMGYKKISKNDTLVPGKPGIITRIITFIQKKN